MTTTSESDRDEAARSSRTHAGRPAGPVLARARVLVVGPAIALFLMGLVLFWLHAVNPDWGSFQGDLRAYVTWSERAATGEGGWSSRPILRLLIASFAQIPGVDYIASTALVLSGAVVAGYVVTLMILRASARHHDLRVVVAVALALSVASAIYAPMIRDRIYSRIGTPNIWHNPPQILLAPLALAAFFAIERWIQVPRRSTWLAGATLLALTPLVKPNFALAVIPGVVAYAAFLHRDRLVGVIGLVTPTLAVLAHQYLQVFGAASSSNAGIVLGLVKDPWMRPVYAILALAFAIVVLIAAARPLPTGLVLAWIVVAIAFAQRMFLLESGPRSTHGNWHWGYFIALKVVLTYSAAALLRSPPPRRLLGRLAWAVLGLQTASGLLYLYRIFTGSGFLG